MPNLIAERYEEGHRSVAARAKGVRVRAKGQHFEQLFNRK